MVESPCECGQQDGKQMIKLRATTFAEEDRHS